MDIVGRVKQCLNDYARITDGLQRLVVQFTRSLIKLTAFAKPNHMISDNMPQSAFIRG